MSDFWRGKKVFVTGATGLVGSWLVNDLLARGASVTGLAWDGGAGADTHWNGRLRDAVIERGALEDFQCLERVIREHHVHTIFHLGAQTIVGTAHRFPLPTF